MLRYLTNVVTLALDEKTCNGCGMCVTVCPHRVFEMQNHSASAGNDDCQDCGACLDSCPEQLAIDDVLRFRMYFEDYGDEREAMRQYARLERKADACIGCSAPCLGSCPHGIQIQERTIGAHEMLTLAKKGISELVVAQKAAQNATLR